MHEKNIIAAGRKIEESEKVLIMLHGRGGTAEDILSLAAYLNVSDYALLLPEATNHSWYPLSFLAPLNENEPWLSSAIRLLKEIVDEVEERGIASQNIYLLGFSQGACLSLEFAARHPARYGGVAAFTGGLIGDRIYAEKYKGDLRQTPVFIGTSDPDPHVPLERVNQSVRILKEMNADVTEKIYPGMGHTVSQDEIRTVNELIFKNR